MATTPGQEAAFAAPSVTIILPCLNEEDSVGACVTAVRAELERLGYAGEVLVVDSGSVDASVRRAREAGARVVNQPIPGYGAACIRGIEEARGEYLVFMDADGTYDPSVLSRFVEPLCAGFDLVVGTRRNGEIQPGALAGHHLHLLEPIQNYLFRRWSRFHVSDVRCGMRSLRRETAIQLGATGTGMEFASDLLSRAGQADLRVLEVPVTFTRRMSGEARRSGADGWRVIRHLLLMSPARLFLVPGLAFVVSGLAGLLALARGPIHIAGFGLDYHFMFGASAAVLFGIQLVLLAVYTQTLHLIRDPGAATSWAVRFHLRFSMGRGILVGMLLILAGGAISAALAVAWVASGRGDFFAVRPAVIALTLILSGAEIVFASIFLAFLRSQTFGRI